MDLFEKFTNLVAKIYEDVFKVVICIEFSIGTVGGRFGAENSYNSVRYTLVMFIIV